jgi:hypothetical protein
MNLIFKQQGNNKYFFLISKQLLIEKNDELVHETAANKYQCLLTEVMLDYCVGRFFVREER